MTKYCSLCKVEDKNNLHYEDDICYICDCEICGSTIVVLKAHRKPIKNELEYMLNKAREQFDMNVNTFNFSVHENKNHFHFHLKEFKGGADEPLENHYF